MLRRIVPLLIICSLLPALFIVRAETAVTRQKITKHTPADNPPPLPNSCVTGGTPPGDYNQPVCCVSGYVYLNGQPIAGAEVAILSESGFTNAITTTLSAGSPFPAYASSLDGVMPGETVTVTAAANGQTNTAAFTAQSGGQQLDIVLPYNGMEAVWQRIVAAAARQNHELAPSGASGAVLVWGGSGLNGGKLDDGRRWEGSFWQPVSSENAPSPRYTYRMAYDPVRQVVVLFGGYDDVNSLGDTWEWDGVNWTRMDNLAVSPPARHAHAMAYDPVNGVILLFGGWGDNGRMNDTWEWNGETWTQIFPGSSPSARSGQAMADGAAGRNILLFGGNDGTRLQDTWEWDAANRTWVQQFPSNTLPSKREEHELVLMSNGRAFLFGGIDDNNQRLNDSWEWDHEAGEWVQLNPDNRPPARSSGGMAYDAVHDYIVLHGGATGSGVGTLLSDTWIWDGVDWTQVDTLLPPPVKQAAFAYQADGRSILVGGYDGGAVWYTETLQLENGRWQSLSPAVALPPRAGHQLAGNQDGSQMLTNGGKNPGGLYMNDTWLLINDNWVEQTPLHAPSPRAFYSLTYDEQHQRWLLFGGYDGAAYLNDLWSYDGTDWVELSSGISPAARSGAILIYDSSRNVPVLFGGHAGTHRFNDIWELTAAGWVEITPTGAAPEARYAHGAAYDSLRTVVVIAGGIGNGLLDDVWEWNGSDWRQRYLGGDPFPAYDFGMIYDVANDWLAAVGGTNGGSVYDGWLLQRVTGSPLYAAPIATINRIRPRDAQQGVDEMTFQGSGADADFTDVISATQWLYNGAVFSDQAVFTMTAATLTETFSLGLQTVSFRVQDDEGEWSAPVQQDIYIRNGSGGAGDGASWTHLIYASGDNDLYHWLGDYPEGMLRRLKTSAYAQPGVTTVVLYDGNRLGDTIRGVLDANGNWTEESMGELRMDDPQTLISFINWGYETFNTDYYALSIADHANGVVGIGLDTGGGGDYEFLTPIELRTAFNAATNDGARELDIVHFDGCSFGLFEDAAIAHDYAAYVVASPNTAWAFFPYELYRQAAGRPQNEPRDYAIAMGETYGQKAAFENKPYTISVMDMAYFDPLNAAISDFGNALLTYASADPQHAVHISQLRQYDAGRAENTQLYDSYQPYVTVDTLDAYVDLTHWALRVNEAISDTAVITETATAVLNIAHPDAERFIAYESHASGIAFWNGATIPVNLDNAYGLGIYYPAHSDSDPQSDYQRYISNQLFDITADSGWRAFIAGGVPAQPPNPPEPTPSGGMIPSLGTFRLFLPLVIRP